MTCLLYADMTAKALRIIALVAASLLLNAGPAAAQSAGAHRIILEASMTQDATPIPFGVHWRVYGSAPGEDGKLPLLAQAEGGRKAFDFTPGAYLVHAAYGYASAVRRIVVEEEDKTEMFTLNAGALQLNAVTGTGSRIAPARLRFDIYAQEADERGIRKLIARNIRADEVVPFPEGTYHVVSQYGRLNAEIRADLRVEPGKVTQATIEHRAARMTFRLVEREGGDAIANTQWSILTESGDVITESASAFPAFVLSEGTYTALARNTEKVYSRDFRVISGVDQDVELLAE